MGSGARLRAPENFGPQMLSGAILGNSSGKLIEKKYVYAGQELQVKKGNFKIKPKGITAFFCTFERASRQFVAF